jgi:hypothetical protein
MGRYMINDGADRFTVRDDRGTVVGSGLSLVAAIELVHEGCRFCDTGQNHTNDAVRSHRRDPRGRTTTIRGSLRRARRAGEPLPELHRGLRLRIRRTP